MIIWIYTLEILKFFYYVAILTYLLHIHQVGEFFSYHDHDSWHETVRINQTQQSWLDAKTQELRHRFSLNQKKINHHHHHYHGKSFFLFSHHHRHWLIGLNWIEYYGLPLLHSLGFLIPNTSFPTPTNSNETNKQTNQPDIRHWHSGTDRSVVSPLKQKQK